MSGNSTGPTDDSHVMHRINGAADGADGGSGARTSCARCREVLSAVLDGEATLAERASADGHLVGCPDCRAWHEDAAALTRRARTGAAGRPPDVLSAGVLDHAPAPRRWWARAGALRGALVALGVVQLVLGVAAVLAAGLHTASHDPGHAAMPAAPAATASAPAATAPAPAATALDPTAPVSTILGSAVAHVAHESAAWNLALGAAFLVGGLRPRHLAGLLPALGIFIAVLAVVSAVDLAAGRVDLGRVMSHLVLVAGFVVAALVVRRGPFPGPSPTPGRGARLRTPAPPGARPPSPAAASPAERRSDVA